jgi:hypothetical protein
MNRNIISFFLFFVLLLAVMSISVIAQAVDSTNTTTTDKSLISSTVIGYSGETMSMTREAIDNDYLAALLLLVTLGLLTKVVTHYTVRSSDQVNTKQSISLNIQGVNKKRH